ncbi:MAG: anthranilate synthase component I [Deltaproteobacteria bacterium]|nr:anthranilate synthase component I [Deltaproteobacteria bacterium]
MASYVPSRDEFRAASLCGNLLPVYREILADGDTPVSAFAKLGRHEYSFLLESVVGGEKWAAYSFLGVEPRAVVKAVQGEIEVTWRDVDGGGEARRAKWAAQDPALALQEILAEFRPVAPPGLPRFWGGAVGWLGYDVVRAFERLPASAPSDLSIPDACMVLTDTLVIFDNLRQTLKVVAAPFVPRPEKADEAYDSACRRIDAIVDRLRSAPKAPLRTLEPPPPGEDGSTRLLWGGGGPPRSNFGKQEFLGAVHKAKEYILAGDAFQIVLSQRFEVESSGIDELDVYRALRVVNPSPYMFHLEFPEARVTGASPECMVRLDGGRVELRPIAGTRPRGKTLQEDEALACELLADPKERAEHVMLIDLARNDVGRVSSTGSVSVNERLVVERYSHVMHLTSNVQGTLLPGKNAFDVLRATFPAGTLTGAPKIRAMEIIDELEPSRRGIYGGAVGYLSYTGNLDLAIAIRTLVSTGNRIHVQAGAGVVHDSVPEKEYEETLNKARAVLRAVHLARGAAPGAGSA